MVVALGVVVIVAVVALLSLRGGGSDLDTEASPLSDYAYPVQMFPPDPAGRNHFPPGQTYDNYNSNPPTSGPHASVPAQPGISDLPVPKETSVHNMEHGQVVVWYNCSGGPQPLSDAACGELRDELGVIVTEANQRGKRVLMTPYANMGQRIALTAWQFLDAFDDFDAQRARTFIDTFYCRTDLEGFC